MISAKYRCIRWEGGAGGECAGFYCRTGQGQRLLEHELTHVLQQCNVTLQPGVDTAQSDNGIVYEDNIAKSVSQSKELMPLLFLSNDFPVNAILLGRLNASYSNSLGKYRS